MVNVAALRAASTRTESSSRTITVSQAKRQQQDRLKSQRVKDAAFQRSLKAGRRERTIKQSLARGVKLTGGKIIDIDTGLERDITSKDIKLSGTQGSISEGVVAIGKTTKVKDVSITPVFTREKGRLLGGQARVLTRQPFATKEALAEIKRGAQRIQESEVSKSIVRAGERKQAIVDITSVSKTLEKRKGIDLNQVQFSAIVKPRAKGISKVAQLIEKKRLAKQKKVLQTKPGLKKTLKGVELAGQVLLSRTLENIGGAITIAKKTPQAITFSIQKSKEFKVLAKTKKGRTIIRKNITTVLKKSKNFQKVGITTQKFIKNNLSDKQIKTIASTAKETFKSDPIGTVFKPIADIIFFESVIRGGIGATKLVLKGGGKLTKVVTEARFVGKKGRIKAGRFRGKKSIPKLSKSEIKRASQGLRTKQELSKLLTKRKLPKVTKSDIIGFQPTQKKGLVAKFKAGEEIKIRKGLKQIKVTRDSRKGKEIFEIQVQKLEPRKIVRARAKASQRAAKVQTFVPSNAGDVKVFAGGGQKTSQKTKLTFKQIKKVQQAEKIKAKLKQPGIKQKQLITQTSQGQKVQTISETEFKLQKVKSTLTSREKIFAKRFEKLKVLRSKKIFEKLPKVTDDFVKSVQNDLKNLEKTLKKNVKSAKITGKPQKTSVKVKKDIFKVTRAAKKYKETLTQTNRNIQRDIVKTGKIVKQTKSQLNNIKSEIKNLKKSKDKTKLINKIRQESITNQQFKQALKNQQEFKKMQKQTDQAINIIALSGILKKAETVTKSLRKTSKISKPSQIRDLRQRGAQITNLTPILDSSLVRKPKTKPAPKPIPKPSKKSSIRPPLVIIPVKPFKQPRPPKPKVVTQKIKDDPIKKKKTLKIPSFRKRFKKVKQSITIKKKLKLTSFTPTIERPSKKDKKKGELELFTGLELRG